MTPRGLALRGALLFVLFAILHAAGLRAYLPLISGSPAPGALSHGLQAVACAAYLASYMAATVLAPILLIAAGVLSALPKPGSPQAR